MPPTALLELHCPPGFASVETFRERLQEALSGLEAEATEKLKEDGRSFLGVRRVREQDPTGRPASREPRRGLNPRVASLDRSRLTEALRRLKEFAAAYREALADWRRGIRDVVFPEGTYQMQRLHAARCAAPA